MTKPSIVVCLVLWATACGSSSTPTAPTPPPAGTTPQAYVVNLVRLIETGSFKRTTIDWVGFRSRVIEAAAGASTIADTYPAIRLALEMLADGHTSYRSATNTVVFFQIRVCFTPIAAVPALPPTIGYVRVNRFAGTESEATLFANDIRDTIAAADRGDPSGWIVDLRGNAGGSMWPMLAGIGPVLGDGVSGFLIDADDIALPYEYRDGASWYAGRIAQGVSGSSYQLRTARPRVAVLTDTGVASSGEAIAVAFRARPDTRSFGVPTCGLSTSTEVFTLSDGATLTLATKVMADRARTKYGVQLVPDETLANSEQVVPRAVEWLQIGR